MRLCAIFLATLAIRLSLDVTINAANTIGLTVHTTRGYLSVVLLASGHNVLISKSLCQKRMLLYVSD